MSQTQVVMIAGSAPKPAPQLPPAPTSYEGIEEERVAWGAKLAAALAPYTTYGEQYRRGIAEALADVARATRPDYGPGEHFAWVDFRRRAWALAGKLALRHDRETGEVLEALPELDTIGPMLALIGALAGEPGAWRLVRCPR